MLIKAADDRSEELAALEALASRADAATRKRIESELRARRAGIKGEAESAYHIDFHFAASKNWAVIHDLRIEQGGRVAQVDHLLINRFLEFYVLESKHFHSGLKITEGGEFLRWNNFSKTYEGMASPLLQNERHIDVLRDAVARMELPTRLGVRLAPGFQTLVLVSAAARVDRPERFDSSRVIKVDQLRQRIWKDIDDENGLFGMFKTLPKLVGPETVERLGRALAGQHAPVQMDHASYYGLKQEPQPIAAVAKRPPRVPTAPNGPDKPEAQVALPPKCKQCSASTGQIQYGKYGYYFTCDTCQVNTAIRFTCRPGHRPRLRKAGAEFFRECAECKSSQLYFNNATHAPRA